MLPRKPKPLSATTPVEATRHVGDTRVNIPTVELKDFALREETTPYVLRYPRDPSLDPQLVWKGKDEQDGVDLEVPSVPIYIQEHIAPRAIIEDLRKESQEGQPRQASLFADFNGMELDKRVEFYQHAQHWTNRMILGDSLLTMASLADKEGLKGQVQMIYLDPPYGIKFGSNWQVSTRRPTVRDGSRDDATREPEQIKAFRDTWKLGIHSYLAYWRDRLVTARELLTETGSIFVQIGDENVHFVRNVLDEVYGSENFISQVTVVKRSPQPDDFLSSVSDYLLWYGKNRATSKFHPLFQERKLSEDKDAFTTSDLTSSHFYASPKFEFMGRLFSPGGRYWSTSITGLNRLALTNRLVISGATLRYRRYEKDFEVMVVGNNWDDVALSNFGDTKVYAVQTATKVIERCMLMTTDPGDLVLDPTCGSGTTAYVAEQWGRRWITIDTSRVAIALARTRLMSARYPYYLLADTPEGIKKEADLVGAGFKPALSPPPPTYGDIKKGFVYKRVPHVMLQHIANNTEIDGIHARWQEKLEPVRADLNRLLKQSWEEWQVPRDLTPGPFPTREGEKKHPSPARGGTEGEVKAKDLLAQWWALRLKRQQEIDASIARHADTETLYDQPYEDNKVVRVTGPFTVESLSPHRVIAAGQERPASEEAAVSESGPGQFDAMILENLRKAGVQNTMKNERLTFQTLDSFPGVYIHGQGTYEENGETKRAAICIGPEHGTVGKELVQDAAKEAVKGMGFDLLVVCGFAFDGYVGEEAKRFGVLTVLTAKINPDLQMGDEFLKKTGAGNMFMVFGEPDIDIRKQDGNLPNSRLPNGKLIVEIKGLDVYDPTTGQIRSHTTDDIACWFLDTDYNEECFFVRHAYFCGGDEPYERLQRALKADVDEAAWASLYSTVSRPFDPPKTGRIAVKVINHYGDEVLKVYKV